MKNYAKYPSMNQIELDIAEKKIKRCIESCVTPVQLAVCIVMMNNLFRMYGDWNYEKYTRRPLMDLIDIKFDELQ